MVLPLGQAPFELMHSFAVAESKATFSRLVDCMIFTSINANQLCRGNLLDYQKANVDEPCSRPQPDIMAVNL